MAVEVYEMTDCYKCTKKIMALQGMVHPLCDNCQGSFDDWFAQQLKMFEKN
jgi:hypothetical protein